MAKKKDAVKKKADAANKMSKEDECELGEVICERTPYAGMRMPLDWKTRIEWDQQVNMWSFQGAQRRVARSLRIPVLITDEDGDEYLDWLLIGYEGHGP